MVAESVANTVRFTSRSPWTPGKQHQCACTGLRTVTQTSRGAQAVCMGSFAGPLPLGMWIHRAERAPVSGEVMARQVSLR